MWTNAGRLEFVTEPVGVGDLERTNGEQALSRIGGLAPTCRGAALWFPRRRGRQGWGRSNSEMSERHLHHPLPEGIS